MYLKCLLICHLLIILLVKNTLTLSCSSCSEIKCRTDLKCPGGKVFGACHCCLVCAKQKNEVCGGLWGLLGRCDEGLVCEVKGRKLYEGGVCQEAVRKELETNELPQDDDEGSGLSSWHHPNQA
ncbi:cysteine-rich motor neuron 1 protein precursor [Silurus meridionalis]|uniref:IGFBP N-terminal domain-containing protein n=1 Tax=Silurus meridionalis TaxID=175797 RepID=A0A8T0AAM5_SILME|nr:hypothetical protein HF521_013755 [Silurus meridionalis]KAI5089580.1 cysteine-rich motor neuron 1 protein precursor [Silurus meridionalis]